MTSLYQIPVNNEYSGKMNSTLNTSTGSLTSTRNNRRVIPDPISNTSALGEGVRVGTPGSSGYGSGNESTNNQPTSPFGSSPRIFGNCAECGLRIVNVTDACHAMGYLYHNSCFVCCCCKRSLRGKVFYKDQDKIYCEEDYLYCGFQQTVEKCFACGHIIAETILLAMGNTYHPGCFRCCICTKCLDGIPFTFDSRNLIYCLPDYHLVNGPLCGVCGLVIMPEEGTDELRRVVALGKEFHIDCYRCVDCKRSLGDEPEKRCYPFNEPDPGAPGRSIQRILCLNCHLQRIGAIPATLAGNGVNNTSNSTTTINSGSSSSGSVGHVKSNSGIESHPVVSSHINNLSTRYSTLPTRIQGSKLSTGVDHAPVNHHYQHYPHQYHHLHQPNTSLTTSAYHTYGHTPSTRSTYTIPNSSVNTTGLTHRVIIIMH
ncbi:unnamed protein product [Heterobilharzia americana]|nr:unnamed protein product [Heterobilharzia americana]